MPTQRRGKLILSRDWGWILIHLSPFAALWTGATPFDWAFCLALYFVRYFFASAGYHRYFSHRAFKTSRAFQFILAVCAETCLQKGVLWWAYVHREHHRYSDTWDDPHSRVRYGFWYSHVGWIFDPQYKKTRYDKVRDLAKYREFVWLNENYFVPAFALAVVVFFVGGIANGGSLAAAFSHGWSTIAIGWGLSTVLLWHGIYTINSLMHKIGTQRYETGDQSRNCFVLTLITVGEGWHNNHHYYPTTARHGFYWWEFDPTYYILKVLSWFGIVWNLRSVPEYVKRSRNLKEAWARAREAN